MTISLAGDGTCTLSHYRFIIPSRIHFVFLGGKKSKAQKRREQKEKKEREREQRILEEEETNKKGARHIEAEKLKRLLARKNQVNMITGHPRNSEC